MAKIDAQFEGDRPKRKRRARPRRRFRGQFRMSKDAVRQAGRELKLLDAVIEFFKFERRERAGFLKRWQKQAKGK